MSHPSYTFSGCLSKSQVWGGFRIYSSLEYAAIINATQDFTENYDDPKAAIIVTGEVTITDLVQVFVVFYFYDGPAPPAGVFDKFNAIPFLSSSTTTQTYASLVCFFSFLQSLYHWEANKAAHWEQLWKSFRAPLSHPRKSSS
jgi:hypothetical protein